MITNVDIEKMAYADFVAFIGQVNTPPGGEFTLGRWLKLSGISKDSVILDLACSTGFSSRTIAQLTQCRAFGIDISQMAIDTASNEAKAAELGNKLKYSVQDAVNLQFPDCNFTHILAGCNFSFIKERDKALSECRRVLKNDGLLCTSNFFYISRVPEKLLKQVESAINFLPNQDWDKKYWQNFIGERFSLLKEEGYKLPVLNNDAIKSAIYDFIYSESKKLADKSPEIKKACYDKLLSIRLILNEHRRYQAFSIAIWEPI